MARKANPIHQKGERNIWCPYYGRCLDQVLSHAWETWNCSRCSNRTLKHSSIDLHGAFCDGMPYSETAPPVAEVLRK